MKALFAALLICLGGQAAAAAPCAGAAQAADKPAVAQHLETCGELKLAAAPTSTLQKVAVHAPVAAEAVGFIAPSPGRAVTVGSHPARDAAPNPFNDSRSVPQPQEPQPDGPRGRSLLLVGLALMAGIALRRYGADHG